MRRFAPFFLLAAAAAGEGELQREVEAFVDAIREEKIAGKRAPFVSRIDGPAFVDEMAAQGLPTEGLKELLATNLALLAPIEEQIPVESFRVRMVQPASDGAVAVVDIRAEDFASRFRLFLFKRDGAWRIRDFEMPEMGMRCSAVMGLSVQAFVKGRPGSAAALVRFTDAMRKLNAGDHEGALLVLDRVGELPGRLDALRFVSLAIAQTGLEEYEEALKACDEAERRHADLPIVSYLRAVCLSRLGRPEEVVAAARRHIGAIGETADVCEMLGDALLALDRADEAAAAYRAGLREDPRYAGNLRGLVGVGAPAEEITAHLRKTGDAPASFRDVAWEFLEKPDKLRAIVAAYRAIDAGDPWIAYFEATLLRIDEKPLEAIARVASVMEGVKGEDREIFADLHAEIAVESGKAIEAYEATPGSFDRLAAWLSDREDGKALAALVARRAEDGEPDASLRLWTIEVSWLEGRHEDVARLAALHADGIRAEREDAWPLDDRLVRSLAKLGREEEALRQARRIADEDEDRYYVLLVRVAFGRTAEAIREFERCVDAGLEPFILYEDEALAPLAKDDAYASLRARYPAPEDDE